MGNEFGAKPGDLTRLMQEYRLAKEYSISQTADWMHADIEFLQALEGEDFAKIQPHAHLVQWVFVNYSGLAQKDPQQLIQAYEALQAKDDVVATADPAIPAAVGPDPVPADDVPAPAAAPPAQEPVPASEARHTITVHTTEAQLLYAGRALDPANIDPRTNGPRPKIEGIGEFISRLAKMYKGDNTAALAQADAAMADAEATLQKIAGEMTGMEADGLKTTMDASQRARKLDIGYTFPAARRLAALLVAYDDVVLQIIAANRFARLKNKERDGQLAAARKPFNRIFAVTGKMPL